MGLILMVAVASNIDCNFTVTRPFNVPLLLEGGEEVMVEVGGASTQDASI